MTVPSLSTYRLLSRLPWPRSFLGKLFFVAFLGTHVPLLGLLAYILIVGRSFAEVLPLLVVATVLTLVGCVFTLLVLRGLIAPVLATTDALEHYVADKTRPDLPTAYDDEAGQLMQHTQRTIEQLDDNLRFKNHLLRMISHDARTPLSSIVMATDIIQRRLDQDALRANILDEMTDIIHRSAQYQLRLFDSVMQTVQADAERFQIRADQVTLRTLIDLVMGDMRLLAQDKDVTLSVNLETADHMILRTDVTKLRQILGNLVSNAIKFSPRGSQVDLGATVSADTLLLYVQDRGIGIAEDVRMHLFQPFSDQQQTGTEDEPGFGVGLWVSKTFAELLGGGIDVESRPGEGSTFIVHFPLEAIREIE